MSDTFFICKDYFRMDFLRRSLLVLLNWLILKNDCTDFLKKVTVFIVVITEK